MSSTYIEIPKFEEPIAFRTFENDGFMVTMPHFHKEIEFIFAQKGSTKVGIEDRVIDLQEHEIIFFPSGYPHYFLASPESQRLVYQFDLNFFKEEKLREQEKSLLMLFEQGEIHSRNWPQVLTEQMTEVLLSLFHTSQQEFAGKYYQITSDLYQLISLFYQHLPKGAQAENSNRSQLKYKSTMGKLNAIFKYVEDNYLVPILIEDVANLVGYNPQYFTRFFKRHTGQTFMEFLNDYRIDQAKFILANEDLPMLDVAEKSGFASVKTFHHNFKNKVGISPLQYQKQVESEIS